MKKLCFMAVAFASSLFFQSSLQARTHTDSIASPISSEKTESKVFNIIPLPNHITVLDGTFLTDRMAIYFDNRVKDPKALQELLSAAFGKNLSVTNTKNANVLFNIDPRLNPSSEWYKIIVTPNHIDVDATSDKGLFYAVQTLLQLKDANGNIPAVAIDDSPRFGYRGVMLDTSRHFMSKEFIKKLLTQMARFKLNTFHWHIVDGGGWRMESKTYPLLQKKAVVRTEEDWDKWWFGDRKFLNTGNKSGYGDYYTQEDIKDIVAHAKKLHITVIPEIEMPGHSNELFAAYPELSCSGKWDREVSEVCPAKEEVYTFFEKILGEVMELFPSKFIHIGGDEAGKDAWKKCPRCKALMKKKGFKHIDKLQSYMITRMEKFLNKHGREIIGWDEILEGGLAPGATVMSWRGEEGGIEAAKMHHNVIMTPGKYVYLDFYQANPETEPRAIGGYTPVKQVYSYDPIPKELSSKQAKYILGAQANLWTEYVPNESHAEYMLFPRILALAEVDWTNQHNRNYEDFMKRLNVINKDLIKSGINSYPLKNIDISQKVDTINKQMIIYLEPELIPSIIRYTTDGTMPTSHSPIYNDSIVVKGMATITASLFDEKGNAMYSPVSISVDYHKAIGKKVIYSSGMKYRDQYPAGGDGALTDGYVGRSSHTDGTWQGFMSDIDATVDLGKVETISSVATRFMDAAGAWIHIPGDFLVFTSNDNKNWDLFGEMKAPKISPKGKPLFINYKLEGNVKARYVKVMATNVHKKGSWLFADEIVIH